MTIQSADFRNRVRSLYNIDKHTLDQRLDENGNERLTSEEWVSFVNDPPRFFIRTDDATATAIEQCVEARQ